MKKIPLRNRDKVIICYATVNNVDYDKVSKISWSLQATGYPQGWYEHHTRTMHQVILDLEPGYRAHDIEVDHKNHNKLDNRRGNLVVTNRAGNSRNQQEAQVNTTTGYLNVCRQSNGYVVKVFGQYYGFYKNLDDAAYDAKVIRTSILS